MNSIDLADVAVRSGVTGDGEGFCTVVATSKAGDIMLGQLSPDEVRAMALQWLAAAEAAETDGIIFRLLTRLDLSQEIIGRVITDMRNMRPDQNA